MNQLPADQVAVQASVYCQLVTGQEKPIVNVLFMPEGEGKPFSRYGFLHDILRDAWDLHQQGYTPHLLLQETEGETARKQDITACRTWVIDIDSPITEQQLIDVCTRLRPSFVVQSSPGKYHLYYLCEHGERFASHPGAKTPHERYAKWIEGAKALIQTVTDMGIDVDTNYTQITKRCRIPGFQRETKDGEQFTPQIIWMSAEQTDLCTRYTFDTLVMAVGDREFTQAINKFEVTQREKRNEIRRLSREQVKQARGKGAPRESGGFDFSQLDSVLDLADAEKCALGFPAGTGIGSRNDTLFSYMYHFCLVANALITASDVRYSIDEFLTLAARVASACNEKFPEVLEDDELERITASAFEFAVERLTREAEEREAARKQAVESPMPEQPAPVPVPEPTPSSGVGKAYEYDYTSIDPAAPFSDMAMADRMLQRFGSLIKRIGDSGELAVFTGRKWEVGRAHREVSLASFYEQVVADVPFEDCFLAFVADKDGNPSRGKIERLAEQLYADYKFKRVTSCLIRSPRIESVPVEDFVELPTILNVKNGVVELDTGALLDHSPQYNSKAVAGVHYDSEATCPTWHDYLQSVFGTGPDGDRLRDYVQRLCGYLISGHMHEQIMALLYGQGSNGKSVLTRTLQNLLGEYAGVGDESDFGAGKKGGLGTGKLSERVMAKFVGKRLVLGSEFSKDTRLKEEAVKRITGQDPAPARYLYGEAFTVIPTFKVVIGTNHLPHVEDDSIALWRRVHIVPFSFSFFSDDEQSKYRNRVPADRMRSKVQGLEDALKAELPGILNWCVEGYQKWAEQGLSNQPEVMQQELAAAQFDNNMAQEIMARCIVDLVEGDESAGMTSTEIAQQIKTEVAKATGQAAQDIDVSARKVGQYLKGVRQMDKVSTKLPDGKVLKLFKVRLDFTQVPMLDN